MLSVEVVKNKLLSMKGVRVKMWVNRGRKKIEKFCAIIKDVYPSVFVVNVLGDSYNQTTQSFAYTEVVCGNVKIVKDKSEENCDNKIKDKDFEK